MPRNNDEPKKIMSVAGVVGTDPEYRDTDYGEVLEFRLAVTVSYEDNAESKWFDVAVWNENLQPSVEAEIYKGAKIAVEGTYSKRESGDKVYHKINAARVGLVQWLTRVKDDKAKASGSSTRSRRPARDEDDDEDERPTRRTAARSSSKPAARSSSRKPAQDDDDEDDELPW